MVENVESFGLAVYGGLVITSLLVLFLFTIFVHEQFGNHWLFMTYLGAVIIVMFHCLKIRMTEKVSRVIVDERKKVKIEFDTYGTPVESKTEKNIFKKLWDKTVFPDMLKARKADKAWMKNLQNEAREEMKGELKEEFKKQFKKKELDKMKGKKGSKGQGVFGKLADEFKGLGDAVGKKDVGAMMGMGSGSSRGKDVVGMMGTGSNGNSGGLSNEDINNMLSLNRGETKFEYSGTKRGKKSKTKKLKPKKPARPVRVESYEDKIKRMLS